MLLNTAKRKGEAPSHFFLSVLITACLGPAVLCPYCKNCCVGGFLGYRSYSWGQAKKILEGVIKIYSARETAVDFPLSDHSNYLLQRRMKLQFSTEEHCPGKATNAWAETLLVWWLPWSIIFRGSGRESDRAVA